MENLRTGTIAIHGTSALRSLLERDHTVRYFTRPLSEARPDLAFVMNVGGTRNVVATIRALWR
jgi:hypothetical protein